MSESLAMQARNAAGNHFREGYNCAESIFLAFNELLSLGIDRDLMRLTSGMGGGYGHAGCSCGALNGAVMVLGALKGRTEVDEEKRLEIYDLTSRFHDLFEENFGSTCCRALNTHTFDTPEHMKHCLKITGNTGKLLGQYLEDRGLVE